MNTEISGSPLTRDERETILRWDDEEKTATMYTSSPTVAKKWLRLGYTLTEVSHLDGVPVAWRTSADAGYITVRKPQKSNRGNKSGGGLKAYHERRKAQKDTAQGVAA